MSVLRKFTEDRPEAPILETRDSNEIAGALHAIGVRFEGWNASVDLAQGADQETVIQAYRSEIDRLSAECGYQSVDVIRLARGTPNTAPMRQKFLREHAHSEDEVRFFVEGRGAFYLRHSGHVYVVVCERNDLISIPAGTCHWFDMGEDPYFTAIRLFINPDGWVANFTGNTIADRFPRLEPLA